MYFVMLRHQNGKCLPLVEGIDEKEWPVLFESEEEAEQAAENNILGQSFGYGIYEWE